MDLHKAGDVLVGCCGVAIGAIIHPADVYGFAAHLISVGGGLLVVWRCIQAFVLEPMGIFWPRPRDPEVRRRKRRRH